MVKKRYKKILETTIMMSILTSYPYTVSLAENVITSQYPAPGVYDSVDIVVDGGYSEGILIYEDNAGEFTIKNGGQININKNASTAYGINANDGRDKATNMNIGGTLNIVVNNSNYTGTDRTMGIWKYGGFGHEGQNGTITLNNTNLEVNGTYNAYGLLAGDDFGGNSDGRGNIISNGDLVIKVTTSKNKETDPAGIDNTNKTFGILAYDGGTVELNGDKNSIFVNGSGSGNNNKETAGIYTSAGGKITSSENSNISMDIYGNSVSGISVGHFDIMNTDKKGEAAANLQGNTVINLFGTASTGLAVYQQAKADINNLMINFGDSSQFNTGIRAADEGNININSLYIGVNEDSNYITDPNKIKAILTDNYWNSTGSAGNITINEYGTGTVQVVGKVQANDDGNININLNNKNSYLYGNTRLRDYLKKIDGAIHLDISNGAKWINVQGILDKSSELTTLTLNEGGLIDMTDTKYTDIETHKWQDIIINNAFDGSGGTIHMDIDASTNTDNSDRVYVDGTHSGTHYITLNNVGSNVDGAAGTVLVSVNDEQGEFKANDSEGTLYWNKYTLDRLDKTEGETVTDGYNTDWILAEVEQTDKPTTSVDTILGANALNYHTWLLESDKLMKRMGDLRHNCEDEQGAWFRVRGSKISRDDSAAFENKYTTYELGYDTLDKETEDYKRYAGASISYSDGSSSYEHGNGENSGKAISFYSTTMRNKGHYLDFVFKVVDMDNDFSVFDTNGNNITGAMDNQGISLNVEYGRKKDLGNKWYIEPQGQLTLGYLGGDNYRLNNGVAVDQGGINSLVGRIGFNIGRDVDEKTNLYLKANLLHEFLGDYSLDMTDTATGDTLHKDGSFGDTWGEIGIGAAIQTGKNNHIYFDVEKTFGGDFEKDWGWNAGVRWTF